MDDHEALAFYGREMPSTIPIEFFDSPVSNKELFICPVCYGPIIDPIMNILCQHTLCRACCKKINESAVYRCPVCRRSCNGVLYEFISLTPFIRAVFDQNVYKCPYENCKFSGSMTEIRKHLPLCEKQIVQCKYKGCLEKGLRAYIDVQHADGCEYNMVLCFA